MTTRPDFERDVSAWLDRTAGEGTPDYLAEIAGRVAVTRQRAWWSSPERWLPMDLTARANALASPRIGRPLLIGFLLVAMLVGALLVIGSRRQVPPPFGLARNGAIVHSSNGDIVSFDAEANRLTTLIGGAENDRTPRVSRDGTMIVFDREVAGAHQLMLANVDGTGVRPLGPLLADLDPPVWSPDGSRVAVDSIIDGKTAVRTIGVDGTMNLVVAHEPGTRHEIVNDVQWRPGGEELVLRAWQPDRSLFGLWTVRLDGTGLRPILPASEDGHESFVPAVSPDGNTVAYSFFDEGRIRLVDIATGVDRGVVFDPDGEDSRPVWSPDGSQIAFVRIPGATGHVAVAAATGGAVTIVGPAFPSDMPPKVEYAPDGSKLIAWYEDTNETWLLDPARRTEQKLAVTTSDLPSWQRLAR